VLVVVLVVALCAAAGIVAGLMVITRMETGEWRAPVPDDLQRVLKLPPRAPARYIVLERRPIEVTAGDNDAPRRVSSVLENARTKLAATSTKKKPIVVPTGPARLPGWKGTDKGWKQLVTCVAKLFEPFNVTVTDLPPTNDDNFVLVPVGGKPGDIGVTDKRIAGLAPFNGSVIGKPIVFAFSANLGNDVRAVCETIGMEVAHAYGLDHGYLCSDLMTYLKPCGAKRFVDKDVRCGELKARNCEGGEPTQNSYRRLLQVLGARPVVAR
jgi:hypothetical protein